MCTPLRGLLHSLPAALAILAATDGADARRFTTPPAPRHACTSPGLWGGRSGLIPNAALEPAGWDDLDGWTGDDHASAFATFYASCRPIVRANAFRAESMQLQLHSAGHVRAPLLGLAVSRHGRPIRGTKAPVTASKAAADMSAAHAADL
jgi:hypothetical protein